MHGYKKIMICIAVGTTMSTAFPRLSVSQTGVRGNWLKKREWYKQAKTLNDDIQQDAVDAQKQLTVFMQEFEKANSVSDTFYRSKGFEQGSVDGLFSDITSDIQDRKKARLQAAKVRASQKGVPLNYYDIQVEAIEDDIKRITRDFEQFKLDVVSIKELDDSLSTRFNIADKYSKEAGTLADKALEQTDDILEVIDDQKARAMYYELKQTAARVSAIRHYLQVTLLQDFKSVVSKMHKQIDLVGKQIISLERRGLVIEHRVDRLAHQKEVAVRDETHLSEDQSDDDQDTVVRKKRRRRKRARMTTSWLDMVVWPFKKFYSFVMDAVGAV